MRFDRHGGCVGVVLGFSCFAAPGAWSAEEQVAPGKVPAIVRQAADKAVPGVKWTLATRETQGRTVSYELEGVNREDDDVCVTVDSAGRLTEVCIEVDLSEVPRVVKNALRSSMPGIKVREAMSVARNGLIVGYSFDSVLKGEDLEVYVTADGRSVEIED